MSDEAISESELNDILSQIDSEEVPEPPKPEEPKTEAATIAGAAEHVPDDNKKEPPVKPSVKMYIDPAQLKADLKFSEADLDMNMSQQAGFYTHYSVAAAQAQRQADTAKNQLEIAEASCAHRLREELPLQGVKVTEGIIKERVVLDAGVQLAQKAYNEAKTVAEISKQSLEAWRQKRDMMVQFSKHKLEEQKGNPVTRSTTDSAAEKLADAGFK